MKQIKKIKIKIMKLIKKIRILPGELVLADSGFNIHESAGLYCAKLPPFTGGKPQLTKSEVDFSRLLSRV